MSPVSPPLRCVTVKGETTHLCHELTLGRALFPSHWHCHDLSLVSPLSPYLEILWAMGLSPTLWSLCRWGAGPVSLWAEGSGHHPLLHLHCHHPARGGAGVCPGRECHSLSCVLKLPQIPQTPWRDAVLLQLNAVLRVIWWFRW